MAKAKTHKDQHHVPSSYLSAWCDPEREKKETAFVWRFTPGGDLIGRKAPVNLFTENDFYTIPMPDGSRNLDLEHGLEQLETSFAVIRKKIATYQLLDARDVIQLLAFMVAMTFRTKAHREHERGQWGRLFELAESMRKQFADGRPAPPIIHMSGEGVPVDFEALEELKERPIQQLLPLQMQVTLPIFASMDLAICEVDECPEGLITCDNPCVWSDSELIKLPPGHRQVSLMSESVEVTLPLSPKQIVLLNRRGVAGYCKSAIGALQEWNRRAVNNADEEVIANTGEKQDVWFQQVPLPAHAWENTARGREALKRKHAWEEKTRGIPRS